MLLRGEALYFLTSIHVCRASNIQIKGSAPALENTNSIFWQPERLSQQMEVWLYREIGTTAERPTRAAKNQKEFTPALLRSASGELLPS